MLGTFGFVLLNAPTVGRLLQLTDRYYPVLYRGMEFDVIPVRGGVRVRYRSPLKQAFSPRHLDEWTLGFFVDRIRQVAGPDWSPTAVSMRSERPGRAEELYERFGPGLRFDGTGTGQGSWFECQKEVLDLTYDAADRGVLNLVTGVAERSLEEALASVSFAARARIQLRELLRSRLAGASELARRMAVSLSTLKRRLAGEGTHYRALYDECMGEYATELLIRTDLRVGRIAWELGYADASSFDHAFRRVFGITPSEFRDGNALPIPTAPGPIPD
jgi:AraC-like DNA-binding protein